MSDINVNFTDNEVKDIIKQSLTGPHKDLLADAILGLLDSSQFSKGALLKAALGTKQPCLLIMNEEYYFPMNHVSTYQFNDQKMKEAGMITGSGKMKGKLIKFNPWQNSPYTLEYTYINDNGDVKTTTNQLSESSLQVVEEFPENFDDQPF